MRIETTKTGLDTTAEEPDPIESQRPGTTEIENAIEDEVDVTIDEENVALREIESFDVIETIDRIEPNDRNVRKSAVDLAVAVETGIGRAATETRVRFEVVTCKGKVIRVRQNVTNRIPLAKQMSQIIDINHSF
jgi:hypothetical protein